MKDPGLRLDHKRMQYPSSIQCLDGESYANRKGVDDEDA